ncbi:MAG: hypothetical protein R3F46_04970 [bacterium]
MKLILATLIAMLLPGLLLAQDTTISPADSPVDLAPDYVPGQTSGLWELTVRLYDDQDRKLTESMTYFNGDMPATVVNRLSAEMPGTLIDEYAFVLWVLPEEQNSDFLENGYQELPVGAEGSMRHDQHGNPVSSGVTADERIAVFHELLAQAEQLEVGGLRFYIYSPSASRAELVLGWKDHNQQVHPPEFYRTAEERAAEEAAGLIYERGAIPVANITVYFSNGGEWAGGDH